jgi:hypothetical protein
MKAVYRKRLEKLATALEQATSANKRLKLLGFDEFKFATVFDTNCKSAGCAMGACPRVFPRHWAVSERVWKKKTVL